MLPGFAEEWQARQCAEHLEAEFASCDPEPDPAVTPFQGLEPGAIACVDGDIGIRSWDDGTSEACMVDLETGEPWCPRSPVHPLAASVVVHEEPGGTWVRPGHRGHFAYVNGSPADADTLRAIVQQGAALLAQEPASPESGEPEPPEDRSKPAPGWDVVPKAKDYEVSRADMSIPAWKRLAKGGFLTRADATAWTWKQHDAQQAWKGGES